MPSVLSLRLQTVRPDLDLSRIQFFRHQTYLLTGVSAAGDDGDSADLEELHLVVGCRGQTKLGLGVGCLGVVMSAATKNVPPEVSEKSPGLILWARRVKGTVASVGGVIPGRAGSGPSVRETLIGLVLSGARFYVFKPHTYERWRADSDE